MQIVRHCAAMITASATALACVAASAQLYLETFDPDAGRPLANYGWLADLSDPAQLDNRIATFPSGGDAGTVVFSYSPQGLINSIYTDTAISGGAFTAIDPTAFSNGVTLSADVQPAFNSDATSPLTFWMVQTGESNWYSSMLDLGVGGMNGNPFSNFQLDFNPAAANWNSVTVANGAGATTINGPAGSNLTGNITGIGLLTMFPLEGTHHLDNIEIFEAFADGDVDGNNLVDINDFNTIRANFNSVVANRSDGDLNRDGFVDLLDFGEWKDNANVGSGADFYSLLVGVPEPTTLALLATCTFAALGRRGWRRSAIARAIK